MGAVAFPAKFFYKQALLDAQHGTQQIPGQVNTAACSGVKWMH
jgi:hypothetical protein